ncbi:MAG: hypothetical protein M1833_007269 [Piccolia ochrophora]|nr:MAG: hypothetical protein M1833_007269 [Piccolia ochrophora]
MYGLVLQSEKTRLSKRKEKSGPSTGVDKKDYNPVVGPKLLQEDYGMEIFRGFGPHIIRFGMSFEVDEETLAHPPEKGDRAMHEAFWGRYAWPSDGYQRFEQCAGLETTADETRSMILAFSNLVGVQELAISMDNGLGWLNGPDVRTSPNQGGTKPKVFGRVHGVEARRGISDPLSGDKGKRTLNPLESYSSTIAPKRRDAKSTGSNAVRFIAPIGFFGGANARFDSSQYDQNSSLIHENQDDVVRRDSDSDLTSSSGFTGDNEASRKNKDAAMEPALKPSSLSDAQSEWLLETEWAQRAFLSSYILAIMDNHVFHSIHSLNIARLPSRHLPHLHRHDFWAGLPALSSLTLYVIPDWRDIIRKGSNLVMTSPIEPSHAIGKVHGLLSDCISQLRTVKQLTIGWASGGERAAGLFARNKHILAAPVAPEAYDLLDISKPFPLLELPFVEDFTLSNCWLSPPTLVELTKRLSSRSLRTLRLHSVSLTSQPTPGLGPLQSAHVHPSQNHSFNDLHHAQAPPGWLFELPRRGSWVDCLEQLSPGITLAQLQHAWISYEEFSRPSLGTLEAIELESCGYLRLYIKSWHQFDVGRADPAPAASSVRTRMNELRSSMMQTRDPLLGTIVQRIPWREREVLQEAFNVVEGWDVNDPDREAALSDGGLLGGLGRVSGSIRKTASSSDPITKFG